MRENFGDSHSVPPVFAFGTQVSDATRSVNVTQDKVAAEFLSGGERLFKIYARAFSQRTLVCTERRLANRFAGEIGGKMILIDGNYRQAAAVHGNAVGHGQFRCERRRVNSNSAAVVLQRERLNRAQLFDDSGKH